MPLTVTSPTNFARETLPFNVTGSCTDTHDVKVQIGSWSKTLYGVNGNFSILIDAAPTGEYNVVVSCGNGSDSKTIDRVSIAGAHSGPSGGP